MEELQHPIQFEPIPKKRIWGGDRLNTLFSKNFTENNIGESWEVSAVKESVSVVKSGMLKGKSLQELTEKYKAEFVGKKNYEKFGNQFPLLIKFIDATDDLSVQVHPNDKLAKQRHNSFGKTEMWYVVEADKNSHLILGFNQELSKERYRQILEEGKVEHYLHYEKVKKGDSFFVEAGLIHAIGKGVLIAEIQQTSDLTYRVYDWDRKDAEGNERELHTELALDALNYSVTHNFKLNKKKNTLVKTNYFTVNTLDIQEDFVRNLSKIDSFVLYMVVEGSVEINKSILKTGTTILFPAAYHKTLLFKGKGKVLETYIYKDIN
ncbi:MAG: type I phosphomannose isomerase catalytic subunit [Flavobacteriales bacterium]